MKKILLLISIICLPFIVNAQIDERYKEGMVPLIDGKVTFQKEIKTASMPQEEIYQTILNWANKRFQPEGKFNARVLYTNQEEGTIAIAGEEYIVFASSALSLDRSRIYYQMIIHCQPEKCDVRMSRIRYWYNEARDGGEKYEAEEWITDKWALNKAKTKLYPITGKFRRKTIDLKDELFKEIQSTLGNRMIELGLQKSPATPATQVVSVPVSTPPAVAVTQTPAPKPAATDDIKTIINQATRMTITAGNDEQFEIGKECWGGFGELFGKKVAFCLMDTQKTMGNLLMTQSENYKISFYHANNNEPVAVIECKKLMTQNINGEEAQKMSPTCTVSKSYNMYVGEILK